MLFELKACEQEHAASCIFCGPQIRVQPQHWVPWVRHKRKKAGRTFSPRTSYAPCWEECEGEDLFVENVHTGRRVDDDVRILIFFSAFVQIAFASRVAVALLANFAFCRCEPP